MFDKSTLIASATPIARAVKFADGTEAELHFLHLPASDFKEYREALLSDDEDRRKFALQLLIRKSLVDDDGKPALSIEEAKRLTLQAVNTLAPHMFEVCGVDDIATKKASPSAAETTSATS